MHCLDLVVLHARYVLVGIAHFFLATLLYFVRRAASLPDDDVDDCGVTTEMLVNTYILSAYIGINAYLLFIFYAFMVQFNPSLKLLPTHYYTGHRHTDTPTPIVVTYILSIGVFNVWIPSEPQTISYSTHWIYLAFPLVVLVPMPNLLLPPIGSRAAVVIPAQLLGIKNLIVRCYWCWATPNAKLNCGALCDPRTAHITWH